MTIFVLILIVLVVIGIAFIWIKFLYKKNKSVQVKLDFIENQVNQMEDNRFAYQEAQQQILKLQGELNDIKNKIINSSGDDLADIINGM